MGIEKLRLALVDAFETRLPNADTMTIDIEAYMAVLSLLDRVEELEAVAHAARDLLETATDFPTDLAFTRVWSTTIIKLAATLHSPVPLVSQVEDTEGKVQG